MYCSQKGRATTYVSKHGLAVSLGRLGDVTDESILIGLGEPLFVLGRVERGLREFVGILLEHELCRAALHQAGHNAFLLFLLFDCLIIRLVLNLPPSN